MARAGGAASRRRAGDALAGDRRGARERRCRTLGSRARVHVGERRWPARSVGARAARPRAGAAPAAATLAEPADRPPFGPGGSLDRDRGDGGRRLARAGARGGARRQSGRDRRRGRASLRGMTALIVVPVFNEAETVGSGVAAARAYAPAPVVQGGRGVKLHDTQSGFRVYPIELFDEVRVRRGGFVFETEVLVAGVARGWRVHEVSVAAIPRARQRSRFRPISDGVAIGGYLAGRVLVRWGLEMGVLVGALVKPFFGERRRVRHRATLEAASVYAASPPLWALSIGSSAIQHVLNKLALWRRDPRPRRALIAAQATAAAPILLGLLVLQAFAPRRMPDFA